MLADKSLIEWSPDRSCKPKSPEARSGTGVVLLRALHAIVKFRVREVGEVECWYRPPRFARGGCEHRQ
jgi:hypothetical protein